MPQVPPKPDAKSKKEPARVSRGERRKQQTREKLLRAAFRLFAERGAESVTINEITEAADVGFGTFYNHFDSKGDIHRAVLDSVFEEFGDSLDALAGELEDLAEVVAASVRHTVYRAEREPLWARLLIRESSEGQAVSRGLGPRLLRDIRKGVESGRFSTPDPWVSFIVVGSSVLGTITAQAVFQGRGTSPAPDTLDLEVGGMAERAAAAVLHVLGLGRAEAEEVARRPLPHVEVAARS